MGSSRSQLLAGPGFHGPPASLLLDWDGHGALAGLHSWSPSRPPSTPTAGMFQFSRKVELHLLCPPWGWEWSVGVWSSSILFSILLLAPMLCPPFSKSSSFCFLIAFSSLKSLPLAYQKLWLSRVLFLMWDQELILEAKQLNTDSFSLGFNCSPSPSGSLGAVRGREEKQSTDLCISRSFPVMAFEIKPGTQHRCNVCYRSSDLLPSGSVLSIRSAVSYTFILLCNQSQGTFPSYQPKRCP